VNIADTVALMCLYVPCAKSSVSVFGVQAVGVIVSFLSFGVPATMFSVLVAVLVGAAAWLVGK